MNESLLRLAAFAEGDRGGNPAGVWIGAAHPDAAEMQRIAAKVGYSETAFAMPMQPIPQPSPATGGDVSNAADAWRVRYFAPETEVPFCGHATIALGAALAESNGNGVFRLALNQTEITVEGRIDDEGRWAALQSPPTHSATLTPSARTAAMELFAFTEVDLDPALPPARIHAGADHFVFALNSRARLASMQYDLAAGRKLMNAEGLITILLVVAESAQRFHARNPFAAGGVYEDPATGAAAAALAGYLRDLEWPHAGSIEISQGVDMGAPSRLWAAIGPETGGSIRVSGWVRRIEAE